MDPIELKSPIDVSAETLATLAEIGQEINSSLNLDEVLAKSSELIKRLIDYEIFAVLLPEEGSARAPFSICDWLQSGGRRALAHSVGRGNYGHGGIDRPASAREPTSAKNPLYQRD